MSNLKDIITKVELELNNSSNNQEQSKFDFTKLTKPLGSNFPDGFYFGFFSNSSAEIPAFLSLNSKCGIGFNIENSADFTYFNELLENSVFKILSEFSYDDFKISLIDGKNKGINLTNLLQLDDEINNGCVFQSETEIETELNRILNSKANKKTLLVVNNFPTGFTTESAVSLLKILNSSENINKLKLFITKQLSPQKSIADLDASISEKISLISIDKDNNWRCNELDRISNLKQSFKLTFSFNQTDEDIRERISLINLMCQSLKTKEKVVFDIDVGLKIPIGQINSKPFYFSLGSETSNYHGIIGGRSGKGKTVLLDNIIANATSIYSPDELRFVLLDMKGIEFNEYKHIPHIQAFCSSSDIQKGLKIVEYIERELKEREQKFKGVGVSNIVDFKDKAGEIMPRLLIIIDEFQNLFTGNYKTDAIVETVLIKQILRLGRAYGVHLLCCTQSMGDGVRSSFLNNIPLRIAFQMTQDQSRSFLSMDNKEAENLNVGQAIYNEQDGKLSSNKLVNITHLKHNDIHEILTNSIENGSKYSSFENLILEDE